MSKDTSVVPLLSSTEHEFFHLSCQRGWGFSLPEIRSLRKYYHVKGREPTDVEIAGLAQSWSEHCSYKSSRSLISSAFAWCREDSRVLGTGDAGVVRLDARSAYALRIESHNHPSAIEPYGGAATGIGGILRDVLTVGAKPIALADPLFFAPFHTDPHRLPRGVKPPRYLFQGVVAGIRDYGNRVGVPTVTGSLSFDSAYAINPLVNVGCLGVLPIRRLVPNRAQAVNDILLLVGGRTGRDGIGGVSFASRQLSSRSETKERGAVQLGNPILKEPLIHACLEAFDRRLVRSAKDLGGGGLATASGELAYGGGFGQVVELDRVPLRESGLRPWEIWISESQERMLLEVKEHDRPIVEAIFQKYDVPTSVVGHIVPGDEEALYWHGQFVGRLRLGFRVERSPLHRPLQKRRKTRSGSVLPIPEKDMASLVQEQVLAPDTISRESVVRVYDHQVQGHTIIPSLVGRILSPTHGDAAVLRVFPDKDQGLALAVASQPWACRADPVQGTLAVLEEVVRNLYAVGARPDAITNCLNFGNPEDPSVLGDFADTVETLGKGARELGVVIPSGNVSFYNEGFGKAIPPTPVLMAVGIIPNIRHAITADLKEPGNALYVIGETRPELGGSLYSRRKNRVGEAVPPGNPSVLRRRGDALLQSIHRGWIRSVHDISDGGLSVTLLEMAFGGRWGFSVDLSGLGVDTPARALVAEGASRWIVEVTASEEDRFRQSWEKEFVTRLGTVEENEEGHFLWDQKIITTVNLIDLYPAWRKGVDPASALPFNTS